MANLASRILEYITVHLDGIRQLDFFLRTDVHVFSATVLCVGNNNAIANEAWATKLPEVWGPTTFMEKYDITGRPVQFHWLIFSGHTAIQLMR